jgi:hypothetical protein
VFCNAQGKPWKKATGVGRFLKIKRKLGWSGDDARARYSTYSCRHTFAHPAAEGLIGVYDGRQLLLLVSIKTILASMRSRWANSTSMYSTRAF